MPDIFSMNALRIAFVLLLLLAWNLCVAQQNEPQLRIGLVTMSPGEEYWSRFGHNAIVVADEAAGTRTSYNYGYFDFDQPGFMARFLRGEMLYRLVALPLEVDLRTYANEGRGMRLQWLNLQPVQAQALAKFLANNALPENADYRYDYFTANCSTKVRDALDLALDGGLKRQLEGRSHGLTYRAEALRLGAGVPWLYAGMHAGLGPFADRPLSIWDESFVPQRLADALEEARTSDGAPLVFAHADVLPDRLGLEQATTPNHRTVFAFAGIALVLVFAFLLRPNASGVERAIGTLLAGSVWLLCGLGGLLLLALWLGTAHVAAWGNENILLFSPICLVLLGALPALWRGDEAARWLRIAATLVIAAAGMALFLRFLPFRIQNNGDFIALLLPFHAVLAWRLGRRGRN